MYKVNLINYDYDDTYYQIRYGEFKEDFEVGRDGLRQWQEPTPPIKEQYSYEFETKEEADSYVSQNDIQEHFHCIETVEISD